MVEIAETEAAIFLFDRDAVQTRLAHPRPQVARKLIRLVDFGGAWRDLGLGEGRHGIADHLRGFAEIEIEAVIAVLRHRLNNLHQAVFSSLRPSSLLACSRIRYFWILPVTVIGKASTNFT